MERFSLSMASSSTCIPPINSETSCRHCSRSRASGVMVGGAGAKSCTDPRCSPTGACGLNTVTGTGVWLGLLIGPGATYFSFAVGLVTGGIAEGVTGGGCCFASSEDRRVAGDGAGDGAADGVPTGRAGVEAEGKEYLVAHPLRLSIRSSPLLRKCFATT